MLDSSLLDYLTKLKIKPISIIVKSRSPGKGEVRCTYFKHPISGKEYFELANVIKGVWVSCALDSETLLLIPHNSLGKEITLADAISASADHHNGKSSPRVREDQPVVKVEDAPKKRKPSAKKRAKSS
jgi:hypothetical protein